MQMIGRMGMRAGHSVFYIVFGCGQNVGSFTYLHFPQGSMFNKFWEDVPSVAEPLPLHTVPIVVLNFACDTPSILKLGKDFTDTWQSGCPLRTCLDGFSMKFDADLAEVAKAKDKKRRMEFASGLPETSRMLPPVRRWLRRSSLQSRSIFWSSRRACLLTCRGC